MVKDTQKLLNIIIAAVFIAISLGLYQAYINVSLTLMVAVLIIRLVKDGDSAAAVIKRGLIYLLIAVLGSALYLLSWKLLMHIQHVTAYSGSYNSMDQSVSSVSEAVYYLKVSFVNLKNALLKVNYFNQSFVKKFNVFCLLVLAFWLAVSLWRLKGIARKCLLLALAVLFTVSLNIANVASKQVFHTLMMFSFCLVNVAALLVIIRSGNKILKGIFLLWISLVSFHSVVFSNALTQMKNYELESTYAHFSRILQRVEMLEDFNYDKDILLIEPLEKNGYFNTPNSSAFSRYKFFVGCGATVATTYNPNYMVQVFDLKLKADTLKQSVLDNLSLSEKEINIINSMEPYPANSSVKRVGKYIVVRNSKEQFQNFRNSMD